MSETTDNPRAKGESDHYGFDDFDRSHETRRKMMWCDLHTEIESLRERLAAIEASAKNESGSMISVWLYDSIVRDYKKSLGSERGKRKKSERKIARYERERDEWRAKAEEAGRELSQQNAECERSCMGKDLPGSTKWVTETRLLATERERDEAREALAEESARLDFLDEEAAEVTTEWDDDRLTGFRVSNPGPPGRGKTIRDAIDAARTEGE